MADANFTKLLVLGAGFSAPAGIPVMSNFFPEAWNLIRPITGLGGHQDSQSPDKIYDWNIFCEVRHEWFHWAGELGRNRLSNVIRKFWDILKDNRKNPNENDMEQFFLYIQKEKPQFRKKLIYVIFRTFELCKERVVGQKVPGCVWEDIYRKIAKELGDKCEEVAVLSFNYDILLDQALLQEDYKPNYYLENIENLSPTKEYEKEVALLKPHGSLNWLVCNKDYKDCNKITVDWAPGPEGPYGFRPGNWQTGTAGEKYNLPPLLIVPPENKNRNRKKSREDQFLESVRKEAKSILQKVEKVAFVGWSVPETDDDFAGFFKNNLENCKNTWIVNISSNEKEQLLKRYKEKVLPDNCNINDCIGKDKGDITNFQSSEWWRNFRE